MKDALYGHYLTLSGRGSSDLNRNGTKCRHSVYIHYSEVLSRGTSSPRILIEISFGGSRKKHQFIAVGNAWISISMVFIIKDWLVNTDVFCGTQVHHVTEEKLWDISQNQLLGSFLYIGAAIVRVVQDMSNNQLCI